MKKRILTLFILLSQLVSSQVKIETSELGKNFDGNVIGILDNDGLALATTNGELLLKGFSLKNLIAKDRFSFYKGVTYQLDEKLKLYRLIDYNNNPITEYVFKKIAPFTTDNTWAYTKDNQEVYIDLKGNVISTFNKKEFASKFNLDATKKALYSTTNIFTNRTGESLFYEGVRSFKHPQTGNFGFINVNNEVVVSADYREVSIASDSLIAVRNEMSKWGFVNSKNGEIIIPFKFTNKPGDFKSNRCLFNSRDNKFGYVDKKGNIAINPKYDIATDFYKGFALVREKGIREIKLIDVDGNIVTNFNDLTVEVKLENLISLIDYKIAVAYLNKLKPTMKQFNGHNVLVDLSGNIVSSNFSLISNCKNGYAYAEIRNIIDKTHKKGLIDSRGKFVVEFVKSQF